MLHGLVVLTCFTIGAEPDVARAVATAMKSFPSDVPGVGAVVGVIRVTDDGVERHVIPFGTVAVNKKNIVPDGATLFEIGSITKAYTGTLLAELVLRGRVRVDDPVQKYLPDTIRLPRRDDRDITLLHLATHTSGLPVQPADLPVIALFQPGGIGNPYRHYTRERLASSLGRIKISKPIGAEEVYSNLGVGILGMALANAAGADKYETALRQVILDPLKLNDTKVTLSEEERLERLAVGHDRRDKPTSTWDFDCLEACGGLRSNVDDMLKFAGAALALDAKAPLTPAFRFAQQPWREMKEGKNSFIGLNWIRTSVPDTRYPLIWHNGGTGGYRSYLGLVREKRVAVVILTNCLRPMDEEAQTIIGALCRPAE